MTVDRIHQLQADGFEAAKKFNVAIPHFVWKVDIEIEYDRDLRLVEETILGLVSAGVGHRTAIAEFMGLSADRAVSSALIDLLQKGTLVNYDDQLRITPLGETVLRKTTTRESITCPEVQLRHDPYRDIFCWSFDDAEYKSHQLAERSLISLPVTGELLSDNVESRYREIQALVEDNGLPFEDRAGAGASKRRRDVVSIVPVHRYVAYREGVLEAWTRPGKNELQWRVVRGGAEDSDVSRRIMEIQAEGGEVLPVEEQSQIPLPRGGRRSNQRG